MKTIKISEFKAKCIRILKSVARSSESVLITRRGKPIARVEPVGPANRQRTLGALAGCIQVQGDIVTSDFAEDWETGGR